MGMPRDTTPRPPDEWKSGSEPMTEAQSSYLKRLSDDAGEAFDPSLSKADASRRIDELRSRGDSKGSAPRRRGRRPAADPSDGTPADGDRMTAAQAAYLKELVAEEGGEYAPDLNKVEAARRIGELLIK